MAKLTIIRLAQSKNQYGSFSYRIIAGTPEPETKLYGDAENIIYSSQKIGVWNKPTEVEQFIGTNKTTGKPYSAFSIDKEMNSFQQRGHTANLAVKSGLDPEKVAMLKLLSELDEQELKVVIMKRSLQAIPAASQPKAVNPSVNTSQFEEADVIVDQASNQLQEDKVVH